MAQTLRERGASDRAEQIFKRLKPLLTDKGRRVARDAMSFDAESFLDGLVEGLTIEEICLDRALMNSPGDEGDDYGDDDDHGDDDEFEDYEDVTTPSTAPTRPGRNEPFWCGSGKKYKKCHLDSDEIAPKPAPRSE